MNREELKAEIKKAYEQIYHEGFADACDVITSALTEAIISITTKIKEEAQKSEVEFIDEYEDE